MINCINQSNILVLENDEKILAYVVYKIKEQINKIIWIDELIVDKENQRMGNGDIRKTTFNTLYNKGLVKCIFAYCIEFIVVGEKL